MRRWLVFLPAAMLAFFAGPAQAATLDQFDSIDGWTVSGPVMADGLLRFSYQRGEVRRVFPVEGLSVVTLTVEVYNGQANTIGWGTPTPDSYGVQLGLEVVEVSRIHGWEEVTLTLETDEAVEVVLWGQDVGFWAGWYGPVMDNMRLTIAPATTPTEPATTTLTTVPMSVETPPTSYQPTSSTAIPSTTAAPATSIQNDSSSTTSIVPGPATTIAETTTTIEETTTTWTTTLAAPTTATAAAPAAPTSAPTTSSTTLPETTTTATTVPYLPPADAPPAIPAASPPNLFDGSHDDVVPPGSTITVAQRRTVVAVSAVFFVMPTPSSSRKRR